MRLLEKIEARRLEAIAVTMACIAVAIGVALSATGCRWNWTRSLPLGLYMVREAQSLAVGELVVVCPPRAAAELAVQREYLARGSCPGGSQPLLKMVAGWGEDVVIDDEGFVVGGRRLLFTAPRALDAQGRELGSWDGGGVGVWVVGPNAWSWDSRYWGPVEQSAILGVARRVVPPWPGPVATYWSAASD